MSSTLDQLAARGQAIDTLMQAMPSFGAWARARFTEAVNATFAPLALDIDVACVRTPSGQQTFAQALFQRVGATYVSYDAAGSSLHAGNGTALPGRSGVDLERLLDALVPALAATYRSALQASWTAEARRSLASHAKEVMTGLSAVKGVKGEWRQVDHDQVIKAFEAPGQAGLFSLQLKLADQVARPLAGVLLVTVGRDDLPPAADGPSPGRVQLYVPGLGWDVVPDGLFSHLDGWLEAEMWQQVGQLVSLDQRELPDLHDWTWEWLRLDERAEDFAVNAVCRQHQRDVASVMTDTGLADVSKLDAELAKVLPTLGVAAALDLHRRYLSAKVLRAALPDWFKYASTDQVDTHDRKQAMCLLQLETLQATLGEYASWPVFLRERLVAAVKAATNVVLEPEHLLLRTERTVDKLGEKVAVHRSLNELAAHGLPAGDERERSDFLRSTTLSYHGKPLPAQWSALTVSALAPVLAPLQLAVTYANGVAKAWTEPARKCGRGLFYSRLDYLAWQAVMRKHLTVAQYQHVVAACMGRESACTLHRLSINSIVVPSVLVVRRPASEGTPAALYLYTPDAPDDNAWRVYATAQQLGLEVLGWAARKAMRDYLLRGLLAIDARLLGEFLENEATQPEAGHTSVQVSEQVGLQAAMNAAVDLHLAEEAATVPAWRRAASPLQLREWARLEAQLAVTDACYQQPRFQLPSFEAFSHAEAKVAVNKMQGNPEGDLDPDKVFVTLYGERKSCTAWYIAGLDGATNLSRDEEMEIEAPWGVEVSKISAQRFGSSVYGTQVVTRYCASVEAAWTASDSTQRGDHRLIRAQLLRLQLKRAALVALLQARIGQDQYQGLIASADSLHERDAGTRARHPVHELVFKAVHYTELQKLTSWPLYLHALFAARSEVDGIYVFKQANEAFLLLPGAPDGVELRAFATFADDLDSDDRRFVIAHAEPADSAWRSAPDFPHDRARQSLKGYFLKRVGLKVEAALEDWMEAFLFGKSHGPQLSAPIQHTHRTFFDERIKRALARVEDRYPVAQQLQVLRDAMVWVEVAVTLALLPFPPAALAAGSLFAIKDVLLAVDAYQEGDHPAAGQYLLGAVLNGLGALADGAQLLKATAVARGVAALDKSAAGLRAAGSSIDGRFAVADVPKGLTEVTQGEYAGTWVGPTGDNGLPTRYVRPQDGDGNLYRFEKDGADGYHDYRLVPPPEGVFLASRPIVERGEDGAWYFSRGHLLGGAPRLPQQMTRARVIQAVLNNLEYPERVRIFGPLADESAAVMWRAFEFNRIISLDVESQVVSYMRQHRAVPAWAEQFLRPVMDAPHTMVSRRYPMTPEAWSTFQAHFAFPPADYGPWMTELALSIEVFGHVPDWAMPYVINSFGLPADVVPAHLNRLLQDAVPRRVLIAKRLKAPETAGQGGSSSGSSGSVGSLEDLGGDYVPLEDLPTPKPLSPDSPGVPTSLEDLALAPVPLDELPVPELFLPSLDLEGQTFYRLELVAPQVGESTTWMQLPTQAATAIERFERRTPLHLVLHPDGLSEAQPWFPRPIAEELNLRVPGIEPESNARLAQWLFARHLPQEHVITTPGIRALRSSLDARPGQPGALDVFGLLPHSSALNMQHFLMFPAQVDTRLVLVPQFISTRFEPRCRELLALLGYEVMFASVLPNRSIMDMVVRMPAAAGADQPIYYVRFIGNSPSRLASLNSRNVRFTYAHNFFHDWRTTVAGEAYRLFGRLDVSAENPARQAFDAALNDGRLQVLFIGIPTQTHSFVYLAAIPPAP